MSWIQNDDNHTFEQNGTFRGLGEGRLLPIVLIGLTLLLWIGFKYYWWSFNNINFLEKLQKNKEISQQPMQNDNSIYDSYPTPIQERQQPLFDRSVDDTIPTDRWCYCPGGGVMVRKGKLTL